MGKSRTKSNAASRGQPSFEEMERTFIEKNRDNPFVRSAMREKTGDFEGAVAEIDKALKKYPGDRFLSSYRDDLIRRKLLFRGEGTTVPAREADCEHPHSGVKDALRKTDGIPA